MNAFKLNETNGTYLTTQPVTRDQIIEQAKELLLSTLQKPNSEPLANPATVREFLTLNLADKQREVFACLYLDNQHRLIKYEELFFGTIDSASVYLREVVKSALLHNAAAVIFAHNHPSGKATPSQADKDITKRLKLALDTVDIRTLDHLVVGNDEVISFAEESYL